MFVRLCKDLAVDLASAEFRPRSNLVVAIVGTLDGGSMRMRLRHDDYVSYFVPSTKDMNSADSWLTKSMSLPGLYMRPEKLHSRGGSYQVVTSNVGDGAGTPSFTVYVSAGSDPWMTTRVI